MRTFEEFKERELYNLDSLKNKCIAELKEGGLKDVQEKVKKEIVQDCQTYIDHIDEVATIKIGDVTNSLIRAIQTAYKWQTHDYWTDFENFIDNNVIGLTSDGKMKSGLYYGQIQCYELGAGINDLLCFKGRDPMDEKTCDLFRQYVNNNFGTHIPMSEEIEQALRDLREAELSEDPVAKDKAFIHFREVQRDAGNLIGSGKYFILETDQKYQDAKTRCSGRSI